jgi:hypothetical protein
MSFQRYPLNAVQKISQTIRDALVLPPHEQQPEKVTAEDFDADDSIPDSLNALGDLFRAGDMPEDKLPAPNKEGRWFVSTVDPADALAKLPGLWIRPGIRLVTYLRQDSKGGIGTTVAIPSILSSTEQLEMAIENVTQANPAPTPDGSLKTLMESLEGDGSLATFLEASIFIREIRELGRFGAYARWTHHRFVNVLPPKVSWQWRAKAPEDFSPKVVLRPDGEVIVEFYSCRVQKPVTLFRHLDRYSANSYLANNQDQVVAIMDPAA